jgi:O-antigen/teichoic acid export membrane protein
MSDVIIIGRLLGESALGNYRMAMNLASAPAEKVSSLLMRTATPVFAKVMDNPLLVRRYYLIVAEMLSLIILPLMLGLVMVAPEAVLTLLEPKWVGVTRPLQWLGLFMIVRVLGVLAEQALISQRQTRFTMRMSVFNLGIMLIAFVIAARWQGPTGVAAAWLALSPVTVLPLLIVLSKAIGLRNRDYLLALLPSVAGSAVMCLGIALLRMQYFLVSSPQFLRLSALTAVGAVVYVSFVAVLFRARIARYFTFVQSLRKGSSESVPA